MTKLQTPYDVALKMSKVEGMVFKDFRKFVLEDLGIKWFEIARKTDTNPECGVYKCNFEANYRAGLWEITIFHTKELDVPAEYKPVY